MFEREIKGVFCFIIFISFFFFFNLDLSYQGMTNEHGVVEKLADITGAELLGHYVKGPLTSLDKLPILPMMTVKSDIGTGIVTSVPSDSPDDFCALRDLKNKVNNNNNNNKRRVS